MPNRSSSLITKTLVLASPPSKKNVMEVSQHHHSPKMCHDQSCNFLPFLTRIGFFGKRLMWRDKLIVSCSCCNILLFGGKASTPDTLHVECSDVCKKKKGFYSIMVAFKSDNLNLICVVWIASHAFVEQKYTWILN